MLVSILAMDTARTTLVGPVIEADTDARVITEPAEQIGPSCRDRHSRTPYVDVGTRVDDSGDVGKVDTAHSASIRTSAPHGCPGCAYTFCADTD